MGVVAEARAKALIDRWFTSIHSYCSGCSEENIGAFDLDSRLQHVGYPKARVQESWPNTKSLFLGKKPARGRYSGCG